MPLFEYQCGYCYVITEKFSHKRDDAPFKIKCPKCDKGVARKVLSTFRTSGTLFKPLSGVDDTDDLTLGKIAVEGKIPIEHKRKVRERIEGYNKKKEAHEGRKRALGFKSDGTTTD